MQGWEGRTGVGIGGTEYRIIVENRREGMEASGFAEERRKGFGYKENKIV